MNLASIKMLVVNVVVMGRVAWVVMVFHFRGLSKISADFATAMGPRAVAAMDGDPPVESKVSTWGNASFAQ